MGHKTEAEWRQIRIDYERGESIMPLAKAHDISHTAIRTRIKAQGWTQTKAALTKQFIPLRQEPEKNADPIVRGGRELVLRMLDELDAITTHQNELALMIAIETKDDRSTWRRDGMLRAIGLPSRSTVAKNLATAAKILSEIGAVDRVGKKAQSKEEAKVAAIGSDWSADVGMPSVN